MESFEVGNSDRMGYGGRGDMSSTARSNHKSMALGQSGKDD